MIVSVTLWTSVKKPGSSGSWKSVEPFPHFLLHLAPPPPHISLFSANSTAYKIELPKDIISVCTSCIKVIPVVRSPEPKANFFKCNFQYMKITVHSFDALCIILYRSLTAIICVLLFQVLYCYRYVICYLITISSLALQNFIATLQMHSMFFFKHENFIKLGDI